MAFPEGAIDLTRIDIEKSGKKEEGYSLDHVDNILDEVQKVLVSREERAELAEAQVDALNAEVHNLRQEAIEEIGQLRAANEALKSELNKSLNSGNDEVSQSTALIQRAARMAEEHEAEARRNAEEIVRSAQERSDAHLSALKSQEQALIENIDNLQRMRNDIVDNVENTLQNHLRNIQSARGAQA